MEIIKVQFLNFTELDFILLKITYIIWPFGRFYIEEIRQSDVEFHFVQNSIWIMCKTNTGTDSNCSINFMKISLQLSLFQRTKLV